MPEPIARMYASQTAATAAVDELRAFGFNADAIHVVAKPETPEVMSPGAETAPDPVLPAILNAGVSPAHAAIYAACVQRGEVFVAVNPPFGFALAATHILNSADPLEVDLPESDTPLTAVWDSAAPLSSWLGWPVLCSDPTPLSTYIKRPVLKTEPEASPTLEKIRQQSLDAAPLSAKLGMPVLSDEPAPLSAKLGWRTLLEKAAPLSERLGWGVLSEQPAPLSERLGWGVLSSNPAPLSTWLGWSVLSDNPTPLSSKFGWSVLSK